MRNEKQVYDLIKDKILVHTQKNNIKLTDLWFRGESSLYNNMPSTLYRQINFNGEEYKGIVTSLSDFNTIHQYEKWIYEKFKGELKEKDSTLYDSITANGWDIVFYMQHYGIPTRFIDWTESLHTALFFATEKSHLNQEDVVLWLFDPKKMNEILRGEYQLQHPAPEHKYEYFVNAYQIGINQALGAAISPHSDQGDFASTEVQRMYSQYGHFVFIPKEYIDMRLYISSLVNNEVTSEERLLKKLVIPNKDARLINNYLESIGCDKDKYKLGEQPLISAEQYKFEEFLKSKQPL